MTKKLLHQVCVDSPGAPIRNQQERVDTACCLTSLLGSSKQNPSSWMVCQQTKALGQVQQSTKNWLHVRHHMNIPFVCHITESTGGIQRFWTSQLRTLKSWPRFLCSFPV